MINCPYQTLAVCIRNSDPGVIESRLKNRSQLSGLTSTNSSGASMSTASNAADSGP